MDIRGRRSQSRSPLIAAGLDSPRDTPTLTTILATSNARKRGNTTSHTPKPACARLCSPKGAPIAWLLVDFPARHELSGAFRCLSVQNWDMSEFTGSPSGKKLALSSSGRCRILHFCSALVGHSATISRMSNPYESPNTEPDAVRQSKRGAWIVPNRVIDIVLLVLGLAFLPIGIAILWSFAAWIWNLIAH